MLAEERHVLIVAYSYPPRGGVGSLRPVRLARSLVELGWRVSVLTAAAGPTVLPCDASEGRIPGVEVLEAPYRDRAAWFRGLLQLGRARPVRPNERQPAEEAVSRRPALWLALRALLLFPDEHVGWVAGATQVGLQRIRLGDINVIVSTSPPESAHVVGSRLNHRTRVPWIADFRDPWSFSHVRPPSLFDHLHRLAEARTLRKASALVTVTEAWSQRFRDLYPHLRHRVIPNGFEEATLSRAKSVSSEAFRLLYTGKVDIDHQDPNPLFEAVAELARSDAIVPEHLRLVFHCYGTPRHQVEGRAKSCGIREFFEWGGPLAHDASLQAQRSAHVLLVFGWHHDSGWIPAKLFDYLSADRRILYVGPRDSEAARIVDQTGRGACVESSAECTAVLREWCQEWLHTGTLEPGGNPAAVAAHAFRNRAGLYDRLLREVVETALGQ